MRQRCQNPNDRHYIDYGGRGISVCTEWASFEGFYADMGDPPEGYWLERVDNNGPYSASNCRWATPREQLQNTRRSCFVTFQGETQTRSEWARRFNVTEATIANRAKNGWPLDQRMPRTRPPTPC